MSVGTLHPETRRLVTPAPARRAMSLAPSPAVLAVVAFTVLAAVLRFVRIGHQGFWFDEANTALLVHFSPGAMIGLLPRSESTPPLYYCVAWVWARVFGYGEAPLRSLSAVVGVAIVPLAYLTGEKLVSRRAGLIAAALVACSPVLIWYSQEARSYEMLAFMASASLLAFACARENPSPRILAAWVIASALALATHYYAVLIVAPEAVWLLAIHRRRRSVQIALLLVGLCGLGLLALALTQNATGRALWISTISLGRRLGQVVPQFAIGFQSPARPVLEPIAIAILALALVLLVTRSNPVQRRGALLAGGLVLTGFVISLLLIPFGFDDVLTRNLLALWLPAALLVSAGLASPRARRIGLVATAALCAIGLLTAVGVAVSRNYERPDWRLVASALDPRPAHLGARAVFIQHYRDLLPLALYLPGLKAMPRHGARITELDVVSFTAPPSEGFCWWGSACNLWPSAMQATYPIPGLHVLWRRQVHQFTVLRMVASAPVKLTRQEVSRVLTTTLLREDELLLQR